MKLNVPWQPVEWKAYAGRYLLTVKRLQSSYSFSIYRLRGMAVEWLEPARDGYRSLKAAKKAAEERLESLS